MIQRTLLFSQRLAIIIMMITGSVYGQIVIPSGATLATSQDTEIAIQTASDVTNSSSFDFSSALLGVELTGATQRLNGNLILSGLRLNGAGAKTYNGNLIITKKLDFVTGYISPQSSTNKLTFIGPEGGITGGSEASYFDCTSGGVFYSSGDGLRLFPIGMMATQATGTNPLYTPAKLEGITGETGIIVIANPSFITPPTDSSEINFVNWDRYWEIRTDISTVAGKVELSLNGLEDLGPEGSITIVQATATGGTAENLGTSSSNDESVRSRISVTAPILAIGKEKTIIVRVHDLITPTGSIDVNDKLYIENIEKFDNNRVTLLDRWGVVIQEWTDFTNDLSYDFSKLGPGSYIAVVEFGNVGEKRRVVQQMVTVLKTN